jgi:hypothetical protein
MGRRVGVNAANDNPIFSCESPILTGVGVIGPQLKTAPSWIGFPLRGDAVTDHAEPEPPDESPSPSPQPKPSTAIQTTIYFPIKAAVEFVARGASIWGLDAGDLGRKWGRLFLVLFLVSACFSRNIEKPHIFRGGSAYGNRTRLSADPLVSLALWRDNLANKPQLTDAGIDVTTSGGVARDT